MKQTFKIPKGCKTITMEQIDNQIITTFEPEFKRGDVIYCEDPDGFNWVFILKEKINREFNPYDYFCIFTSAGLIKMIGCCRHPNLIFRHATPEEAQRLWDALAKQGKRWNPKTMQVEPIRWRAEIGGNYYFLDSNFIIVQERETSHTYDDKRNKVGNYFQSKEQAERVKLRMQKVYNDFWEEEYKNEKI